MRWRLSPARFAMTATTVTLGAAASVAALAWSGEVLAQTEVRPGQLTHFFYTPSPDVSPPHNLVVGLREISYGLPHGMQVQGSLLDNVGRINFGLKYKVQRGLALGAGIASSLARIGDGAHGIPSGAKPRLGVFATLGVADSERFRFALTPHAQVGEHHSVGIDLGLLATPGEVWSFVFEVGSSLDITDSVLYLNVDGGLRICPPRAPFFYVDLGVDLYEFPMVDHVELAVAPYLDLGVTFDLGPSPASHGPRVAPTGIHP